MKHGVRRDACRHARILRLRLTDRQLPGRRGRCRQYHRRLEINLAFRLREARKLEAALKELVGGRCGQRKGARIPPFELRQAAARADFGLEQTHVALREDDLRFDVLKRRAFRSDAERDEIAA